ncbi:hypothetical protein VSR69_41150 [Paraburkholderia phytofirmans]
MQAIRALGLPPDIGRNIHQNRLLRLAREGGQTAVYQIEGYETDRRHATLVAILLDTAATLTDEILNLHDRLIGSFFTKAKHKYKKHFAAEGNAVNDKVRLYAKVGAALIAAKETRTTIRSGRSRPSCRGRLSRPACMKQSSLHVRRNSTRRPCWLTIFAVAALFADIPRYLWFPHRACPPGPDGCDRRVARAEPYRRAQGTRRRADGFRQAALAAVRVQGLR